MGKKNPTPHFTFKTGKVRRGTRINSSWWERGKTNQDEHKYGKKVQKGNYTAKHDTWAE